MRLMTGAWLNHPAHRGDHPGFEPRTFSLLHEHSTTALQWVRHTVVFTYYSFVITRCNGRNSQLSLTAPIMPSSLTTGRVGRHSHHYYSPKPRDPDHLSSSKGSSHSIDAHSPHAGPLRGKQPFDLEKIK